MSDILNKLQNISSDEQKIRINLRSLQEEVRNQYELLEKKKLEKKALDNYLDSTPSSQPLPPSTQGRKKNEKISPEICSLNEGHLCLLKTLLSLEDTFKNLRQ